MSIHLQSNKRYHPHDTIGETIRFYRKKAGLTQSQLAERVGCNQPSIAHYEANRVTPPISRIKKLSWELNISAEMLLSAKLRPSV